MSADPIRFLIVDDIAENLVALEALLRRDGLEVHSARSAAEALELMLVHDYALAFLDVQMPEINGYELAELMRGAERTRRVPIIFVTAAERNETRRFRGYEAGAVDYIFKPIDPIVLTSKAEVFFRIGRQAQDLERQRDELRDIARHRDMAIARLKAHADNSPLAFIECDATLTVREWSRGAERIFGLAREEVVGRRIGEGDWLTQEAAAVIEGWVAAEREVTRHSADLIGRGQDRQTIHCEAYGSVLHSDRGPVSLSLQILDVTERHRAEAMRTLLIGELNHRIKNTLANVQAISRQSLRHAETMEDFERSFGGRLRALARAHSILSDVTWSSASLDMLLDDLIGAGTLDGDYLRRSGPPVNLAPEIALRLALSLHELGTNAAKYGALSTPGGEVRLSWQIRGEKLVLRWEERGGPPVTPPTRQGFGSTLIRAATDDGDAIAEWRSEGVVWTIVLPRDATAAPPPQTVSERRIEAAPALALFAGRRVLLIEDEPLVAMDLRSELEAAGADIVMARTLRAALTASLEEEVDIALIDGNLAGQSVDEVAVTLSRRAIPFCFVSGYGPEHLPRAFRHVPVVQKPFQTERLLSVVAGLLQPAASHNK